MQASSLDGIGPGHTGDGKRSAEAFSSARNHAVIVRAEEPVPRLGVILFGLEGVRAMRRTPETNDSSKCEVSPVLRYSSHASWMG